MCTLIIDTPGHREDPTPGATDRRQPNDKRGPRVRAKQQSVMNKDPNEKKAENPEGTEVAEAGNEGTAESTATESGGDDDGDDDDGA